MSAAAVDERPTINEEALTYMRSQVGRRAHVPGWNTVVTEDGIRHFALGIGDDNPLWWDPEYARGSSLGEIVAPPCYLFSHVSGPRLRPEDGKASTDEFLPGAMGLLAGQKWRWFRPVRVGERISAEGGLVDVAVAASRFGGRSVTQVERLHLASDAGDVVAEFDQTIKRFERSEVRRAGAYADRPLARYSEHDRAALEAQYIDEQAGRRGAEPRYVEDVSPGDRLGPMLKGPQTLTSMIGFLLGAGSALLPTNRIKDAFLRLHPGGKLINPDSGVADSLTGGHIEPALVKASGMPAAYDHGIARFCWFGHLLSDWGGDHAHLDELDARFVRPNFVGDVTWLSGQVLSVGQAGPGVVEIELQGVNQLDEQTCRAVAKMTLPSRAS